MSDFGKSARFHTEIGGCGHLFTTPSAEMSFLDSGGVGVILIKHDPPINPELDSHEAALESLPANGVETTFQEDRKGGIVNGPPPSSRPDGTLLEYIDLTSHAGDATYRFPYRFGGSHRASEMSGMCRPSAGSKNETNDIGMLARRDDTVGEAFETRMGEFHDDAKDLDDGWWATRGEIAEWPLDNHASDIG